MTFEDPNQQEEQSTGQDHWGRGNGPAGKKYRIASNSKFPLISVIPDQETMDRAKQLLSEAGGLSVRKSEIDERLEEIKQELAAVCMAYDLPGFRFGLQSFEYRGWRSRSSLDKGLLATRLAEYGVPASVIAECYVSGEESMSCSFGSFDIL